MIESCHEFTDPTFRPQADPIAAAGNEPANAASDSFATTFKFRAIRLYR